MWWRAFVMPAPVTAPTATPTRADPVPSQDHARHPTTRRKRIVNRYVIEGLLADAASGKRVGLVPGSAREIPEFLAVAVRHPGVVKVRRTNGMQGVEFANGSVEVFLSLDSLRGHILDVLAIHEATVHSDDADLTIYRIWRSEFLRL